jgi:4-amino-4-deoxy-L-arabinose transferase-like glycosyltransferase
MSIKLSKIIPHSAKGAFWLGFGLCLLAGLFIILVLSPLTGFSKTFGGYGHDGYLEIARSVAQGNGFVCEPGQPPVACPPLYPLFLSPITLLPEGLQRPSLVVFQSAMVGGIAFLVFLIGKSLFSISIAKIAVVIFLLNPWIYWSAKNPMTPVMQSFLYILFVFLMGRYVFGILKGLDNQTNKKRWCPIWLAIGLTGGALALTHGSMLPAVFGLLFVAFIFGLIRKNKQLLTTVVISGCVVVSLVAPWTYRNWVVFGRFIPVASHAGFAYFHGLVHWNISGEDAQRQHESYEAAALRLLGIEGDASRYVQFYGLKDPNINAKFNEKAVEHIRTHPGVFLKKFILNSIEYYFPSLTYPFLAVKYFSVENLAITLYHLILWSLAAVGFYRIRRQKPGFLHAVLVLAVIFLYAVWYWPVIAFIGHSLYTFGTMPFLSLLAANGFYWAFKPYLSRISAS